MLVAIVLMANVTVVAQDSRSTSNFKPVTFEAKPAYYSPLYVLKANGETVEIDSRKNEKIDMESIDLKHVKTVVCLSDLEAKLYGDRGSNGVVLFQFKESYILSKAVVTKLKWVK